MIIIMPVGRDPENGRRTRSTDVYDIIARDRRVYAARVSLGKNIDRNRPKKSPVGARRFSSGKFLV